MIHFDTYILSGIPCRIKITEASEPVPGNRNGHPDDWTPDEPGEVDWQVCDRRGRPAAWLARKMGPRDCEQIEYEARVALGWE